MAITPETQPYWIIVSDEGPATKPKRHESYEAVTKEAIRLSKEHPGIDFRVFKYQARAFTPKPQKVETVLTEVSEFTFVSSSPYYPATGYRYHSPYSKGWPY